MGHGEGPGGSSGLLDLFVFKRYLQKKMTTKISIASPAVVDDTHLPRAARLVNNFSSESICISNFQQNTLLPAKYPKHLWIGFTTVKANNV